MLKKPVTALFSTRKHAKVKVLMEANWPVRQLVPLIPRRVLNVVMVFETIPKVVMGISSTKKHATRRDLREACSCTNCQIDTSECYRCGDGIRADNESCDGEDLNAKSCQSEGFENGNLGCTDLCALDVSGCFDCNDLNLHQLIIVQNKILLALKAELRYQTASWSW